MNVDTEQIKADWAKALKLDELKDDPDALTLNQLCVLFNSASRSSVERWAEKGVREGSVEFIKVFRVAGQGGKRWQKAYKLIKTEE